MRVFNPEKELKKIQKGNGNKIIFGVIALLIIIAIGSSYALYQVRYSKRIIYTKVGDFTRDINILAVFVDGVKKDNFPIKDEEVVYDKIVCDNNEDNHVTAYWDYDAWGLVVKATKKAKCNVYFKSVKANEMVVDFTYNGTDGSDGTIQTYIVPVTGRYKLEVWGAQGGSGVIPGGLGGYSIGSVNLEKGDILYIVVGGAGTGDGTHKNQAGGFNGGGDVVADTDDETRQASGGGATHIAMKKGLLKELNESIDSILIVAGGGGGIGYRTNYLTPSTYASGSGGGTNGGDARMDASRGSYIGYGGTQDSGGSCFSYNDYPCVDGTFGQGGGSGKCMGGAGGGGYYGGGCAPYAGGGGSGYLSVNLYNVQTTNGVREGNGFARITYLGSA